MELRNIAKYGVEASEEIPCQSLQRQGKTVIKSTPSTKDPTSTANRSVKLTNSLLAQYLIFEMHYSK